MRNLGPFFLDLFAAISCYCVGFFWGSHTHAWSFLIGVSSILVGVLLAELFVTVVLRK